MYYGPLVALFLMDMPQLETGDKIIMPPSALDRLASLHIEYPMLFELCNPATERVSHCGVLEFIADEGMIYLPYWMMQNMLLQEGDTVQVKNANLLKGTYVKLQPHTKDFLDISNPKAILETTLRNYSCLTTGDTIMVAYNNKKFYIDIIETKPSSAISIIETDCEVDFAPPLDYKEPERPAQSIPSSKAPTQAQEEPANEEPKFSPFTGTGRRLDGKPLKQPAASSEFSKSSVAQSGVAANGAASTSSSSSSHQPSGKLVFGSNLPKDKQKSFGISGISNPEPIHAVTKDANPEPPKVEEPKFQAFTGKKYSLRG
ncbi:hypothetical protein ACLOJK_030003 [Asimina triloba]